MAKSKYTSIGGQALIEGILMKSPEKTALCVRLPDGQIDTSYMEEKRLAQKCKVFGWPVIRGVVGFAESMIQGYKALMISADKSGFTDLEENDENKTDKPESGKVTVEESTQDIHKTDEKKENVFLNIVMVVGVILGLVVAVALFMYLPRILVSGIEWAISKPIESKLLRSCIEQFVKLTVFVGYVWAVSFMKDIKRVFMYHGAEHKTIFCYEKGLELNIENVKKQKRFHPRCGTSFMILMILISVIFSTVLQVIFPGVYTIKWLWVVAKILMIPLICGVGYEVLKICGRYDNIITSIISAPGMWLQRLTTKEPEDDMIEIAIAALKACEPEVPDVERNNDNI